MGPSGLGRILIGLGAIVALVGLLFVLSERLPWLRPGRLPGDLSFGKGAFRLYLPLATSLVVSAALSLAAWLLGRR